VTAHIENTIEFELCADDETPIFVRDWPVTARDTSVSTSPGMAQGVIIMHGLGEHCGRYAHVARFLMHWDLWFARMITAVMENPAAMRAMYQMKRPCCETPPWSSMIFVAN